MLRLLRTPRFWIGLTVTVAWLAMMGLMVLKTGRRGGSGLRRMGVSSEVLMVSWTDYDHWLWVQRQEQTIGLSHLAVHPATGFGQGISPTEDPVAYEMESRTRLRFEVMGMTLPLDIGMEGRMNTAFELQALQMHLQIADKLMLCQAFCEDDHLFYRLTISPAIKPLNLPEPVGGVASAAGNQALQLGSLLPARDVCGSVALDEPILMTSLLMPIITRSEKLEKGAKWTTRASDPVAGMLDMPVEITVQGQEEVLVGDLPCQAWRMIERVGSIQSTVWYDLEGRLLRQDMSNGMRLMRAKASSALEYDPMFRQRLSYPGIDRQWIRSHLDPELIDKPLSALLPGLPSL